MWIIVRTKSRAEKKVESLLNHITHAEHPNPIHADALIVKVKRKWSDRTKIVDIPSVSGYVFIRFGQDVTPAIMSTLLSRICFTPGVLRLLTLPGKSQFRLEDLATITDRELDICRAAAQQSCGSITVSETADAPSPPLTPGTQVRFREGPLAALDTTFVVEDINHDTPTLFINEGIFKNAHFTVSKHLVEVVK